MGEIVTKKKQQEPQFYRIMENGYVPVMPSLSSELMWKGKSTCDLTVALY